MYGPGEGERGSGLYDPGEGERGPGLYGPGGGGSGLYGPGEGERGVRLVWPGEGEKGPGLYGPGGGERGPGLYDPGEKGPGLYGPGGGERGPPDIPTYFRGILTLLSYYNKYILTDLFLEEIRRSPTFTLCLVPYCNSQRRLFCYCQNICCLYYLIKGKENPRLKYSWKNRL